MGKGEAGMTINTATTVFDMIGDGKRDGFGRISQNFTWAEVFGSMQGNEWREVTLLMLERAVLKAGWLQAQRDRYGAIRVTSWLRPPTYNRRIGGATNSQHLHGWAVDWQPLRHPMATVHRGLLNSGFQGGIAMKAGQFIHSDLRGVRTVWDY
jgi:uncharacterized protein YcbK (DUF882 family)